ncbi:shikimate dehydrogenase [Clostridium sp. USBA 49]|uniref:shikimate dehydrogenase n=1 Tax=Clostridium sp. USBA 49 TaxID=1881060 RepID=UPI00099A0338|nr:shikimate dehydrogenase [Clostridium sp. USBA 49]SKA82658.1 shikimate dehydrogenase [Clostridium sp. USBA 49]
MKKLYGLLGGKLSHSFSPEIHSIIFEKTNTDAYYHLFEIKKEDIKHAVKALQVLGVAGVNVTIPYKVEIMEFLDEISIEAKKIGAINTIVFKDNKTYGYNTDYYGFGMTLDKFNVNVKDKKIVLLGTGGVSKAIVQYLYDNNAKEITYVTRDKNKFCGNKNKIIDYNELNNIKNQDIIINCTPCGMFPNIEESPVNKEIFENYTTAIDLIYNPKETKFLKYAYEKKLKTINGLYMLIAQAVKSQELWMNKKIEKKVVDEVYEKFK